VGDNTLVGLPVFTSDGKEVGMAIALATDESDEALLVTQIERPLGFGTDLVAIQTDMFVRKADRIELSNSATRLPDRTKSNDAVPPIPFPSRSWGACGCYGEWGSICRLPSRLASLHWQVSQRRPAW